MPAGMSSTSPPACWTVPAVRMKRKRASRTRLPAPRWRLSRGWPQSARAIYCSGGRTGRPLSNMSMLAVLHHVAAATWRLTGSGQAFAIGWRSAPTFRPKLREMALAHAVGDKVEAAYRRGDLFRKRRDLAEAWARYCTAVPATANVVTIRVPPGNAEETRPVSIVEAGFDARATVGFGSDTTL